MGDLTEINRSRVCDGVFDFVVAVRYTNVDSIPLCFGELV